MIPGWSGAIEKSAGVISSPNASNADSARADINIVHGFIRELHGLPEFEGQVHTLVEMRKHLQAMLTHSATARLDANLRAYGGIRRRADRTSAWREY